MSRTRTAVTVTTAMLAMLAIAVAAWPHLRAEDLSLTASLHGWRLGLPWWWLAVLTVVAERAELVMPARRQSRSTTMSDGALVAGLLFWDPVALLVGRGVGLVISRLLLGRIAPVKILFNVMLSMTEGIVARLVFLALAGGHAFPHPMAATAAVCGVVAANLLSATVTASMVGVLDRSPVLPLLVEAVRDDGPGALVATVFGLIAAHAIHDEPTSLVVLLAGVAAAYAVHAAYIHLVHENRKLSCLYRFNRQLAACETSRDLTEQTLELSRVLLHAEHAEVILLGEDRSKPMMQVVSPLEGEVRWHSRLPEDLDTALVAAAGSTATHTVVVRGGPVRRLAQDPVVRALLGRRLARRLTAWSGRNMSEYERLGEAYLSSLGLVDGVSVPLEVEDRHLGCLIVAGRLGTTAGFSSADVDLLATMASQAAISLHRSELLERVRWEASHDSLTGLPNRLTFNRATQEALLSWSLARAAHQARAPHRDTAADAAPAGGTPRLPSVPGQRRAPEAAATTAVPARPAPAPAAVGFTGVAMLDLDRFHDVNDTFGHDAADEMLRLIAERLRTAAGDDALVARLGSDEFGVLLSRCPTHEHLLDVVQRLLSSLAEPLQVGDASVPFSASAGVAVAEDADANVTSLVVQADVALQAAKQLAGPIVEYSPDIDNRAPHRLAIATDLRGALRDGDLAIHVQPQADLATGCLTGVEALVRWHHPTRGLVFPDEFIPVAEATGLVGELTRVVLDKALAAVAAYRRKGVEVPIAVNLSARSLVDAELVGSVQRALRRHRLPAHLLTLEITESSVMADPQRAIRTLSMLRGLGITLAVDDFGTGYSSLSYLKRLPVQEVKIDKSFVMTLPTDPDNASIVRSIVDLGANLGLRVVAEGVEDARAWAILAEMGCDVAQGYHLARPMPADDLLGWLDSSPVVRRPVPLQV